MTNELCNRIADLELDWREAIALRETLHSYRKMFPNTLGEVEEVDLETRNQSRSLWLAAIWEALEKACNRSANEKRPPRRTRHAPSP